LQENAMNKEEKLAGYHPELGVGPSAPEPETAAALLERVRQMQALDKAKPAAPKRSRQGSRRDESAGATQMVPLRHGPMSAFNDRVAELAIPDAMPTTPPGANTEDLLNGLIGECHFLMREVAFRSMCQCSDPQDRMLFMNSAMNCAKTGAEIGNAVVRLRGGSVTSETVHTMRVERVDRTMSSAEGGGGNVSR
jgi:hypothetical protein